MSNTNTVHASGDSSHDSAADHPPVIQDFTVRTEGTFDEMDVVGASIPDEQMEMLLRTPPGVIYARNQDGVVIEMMFDMDEDSIIALPVEIGELGVSYLDTSAPGASP